MQTITQSRHWLQRIPSRMSLRTLMLLVLVVGGGLGWFGLQRQRDSRRKWVIATIQASGSSVEFGEVGISRILWFGGSIQPALNAQRPLTTDQLTALGSCDRLRELMMVAGIMTDDGLRALSHDVLLERIYCFKPKITDAGVEHLAKLTNLKKLELLRVPELTDAALAPLVGLTDLEEITLSGAGISGPGLVHLAGLSKLKSLVIPWSALDDAGLANLGRLTSLRALYIGGGSYTDAGLAHLGNLTGLTELGVGSDGCTEAGMAHLSRLTNLRTLNLAGAPVTDAWLDRIAGMKALRELHIESAQLSDEAVARLRRALPLVQVYVGGRPR
jgi:hypothetical protein